ncbi:MAG TPA: MAPEG family protein [Xanthobacteraceae bacterium]|jgi:hypothetical protein|nr:MAPEG family protein [Xanthobacteraceae bacterium]
MTAQAVFAPIFVQVALTFVLWFWMGRARVQAVSRGETRVSEIALGQLNWPPKVQQVTNAYINQLQLPVLFYLVVVLTYIVHQFDFLQLVLAWVFVLSRIVHAAIHTTSNYVLRRFQMFVFGGIVLLLMWIAFALRLYLGLVVTI